MSKIFRFAVKLDCTDDQFLETLVARFPDKKRTELLSSFKALKSDKGCQMFPVRSKEDEDGNTEHLQFLYFGFPAKGSDGKPVIAFSLLNPQGDATFCIETGIYYIDNSMLVDRFEWFEYDEAEPFSWIEGSVYAAAREAKLLRYSGNLRITKKPIQMRADDFQSLIVKYLIDPDDGNKPDKRYMTPTIIVRPDEDQSVKELIPAYLQELCTIMVDDDSGIAEEAEEYVTKHPDTEWPDELCGLADPENKFFFMIGCGTYVMYAEKTVEELMETIDYVLQNFHFSGMRYDLMPDLYREAFFSLGDLENSNRQAYDRLMADNNALVKENRELRKKAKELDFRASSAVAMNVRPTSLAPGDRIFASPDIEEKYVNEVRCIVLDSLQKYLEKNVLADSRRADVLKAFLKKNPSPADLAEKKDAVKNSLSGYTAITPQMVNDFAAIGLTLKALGSHARVQWPGDKTHTITISSTPSDSKTGTNAALDIVRKLM